MDAYDIFKKLTKGLKFKYRVLGVKNNEANEEKNVKEEVKKRLENDDIKEEYEDAEETKSWHSGGESENDEDLQIIEGAEIETKKDKKKKDKPESLKKKLELEEQNHFRNEHGIKAVGRHVPSALKCFEDLTTRYNVNKALVDTITQCGYTEPTPVQRQALTCMLEDRQILACAPTGSGKTAAFLLPLFHVLGGPQGGPRALILCPTRELAQQIYREALRLSASTQLRCSIVRKVIQSKVKEREATVRKSDIVISTPNRLCYLLNQDSVNISLDKVRWLIIDEADKMFEGSTDQDSDFRQQLDQVVAACGSSKRRVAMFSATHTPAVAKWCRRTLRGLIAITVGHRNAATHLVKQELLYCGNENGKLVAFRQMVQEGLKPPVLVFVQSKDRARQLFKELIYDGINVDVIHSDRTQAQRDNVVRSFRVGRIWVLICTELMGRGIDFRGVNLVINYDFPPSAIAYVHRVGRAGRAGQPGRAVTFFTQEDVANLRSIASVLKQSGCAVPDYMLQLKQARGERKKRAKMAPKRDPIATILHKRPDNIASVLKQSGCAVPDYMLQLKQARGERKKRAKMAPKRDPIATILHKRPDKRKLDDTESGEKKETKDTKEVSDSKSTKQRKVSKVDKTKNNKKLQNENNDSGKNKENKFKKANGRMKSVKEKKINKKRKKKVFMKTAASS